MRIPPRHIIQRQTVWLDQPSLAFGVQERLSAYCRYQLPDLLESLFDRVADANTVIRLDTLDIDAGTLSLTDFENQLTQQISQQLEQELKRVLNNPQPDDGVVERYNRTDLIGQQFHFFLQHGYLPPWADAAAIGQISDWLTSIESAPFRSKLMALLANQEPIVSRLIAHCSDEALMYVCLPATPQVWAGRLSHLFDCLHQGIRELSRTDIRERYWSAVFQGMTTNRDSANGPTSEWILQRFYLSLYQSLLPALTGSVPSTSAKPLIHSELLPGAQPSTFFSELSEAVQRGTQGMPASERNAFIDSLHRLTNQLVQSETRQPRPANTPSSRVEEQSVSNSSINQDSIGTTLSENSADQDNPATASPVHSTDQLIPDNTLSAYSANQRTEKIRPDRPINPSSNLPITQPGPIDEAGPTQHSPEEIDQRKSFSDEQVMSNPAVKPSPTEQRSAERKQAAGLSTSDEIYVPLAGIVLLHPFLSILFTELKLVHNRAWVSTEASVKGAQILAYLATGATHCPEYSLPLVKLLCGLPFEMVVSPDIRLTDAEKQSTVEVLEAVITHWQALGHTSPAGLQESFLQREGKLTVVEGGWRLTVEHKTIDILLNRLPWGFSMIKLPWMPDLLFVDWT